MTKEKQNFIETWARYCGAPKEVFIGHLEKLLEAETVELETANERLTRNLDSAADAYHEIGGEIIEVRAENKRLKAALADAIKRPLGVVPDSAIEFLSEIKEQLSN